MYIFIWTATEKHPASAEAFSDFNAAWERFGDMKVTSFPHYIQHIDIYDDNEPGVSWYNWSQFIDLHVQEAMNG